MHETEAVARLQKSNLRKLLAQVKLLVVSELQLFYCFRNICISNKLLVQDDLDAPTESLNILLEGDLSDTRVVSECCRAVAILQAKFDLNYGAGCGFFVLFFCWWN